MNTTTFTLTLVAVLVLGGCGGETTPTPPDLGTPDAGGADLGVDGIAPCTSDAQCDDGTFCNGVARCAPGTVGADGRGCVAATGPSCLPSQTCNEAMRLCDTACDTGGDADGDGAVATTCGGTDCDDSDATAFPGNGELCDATHDEDCNPTTFGPDGDSDGYPSITCCNRQAGGSLACGADCDDTRDTVSPMGAESCNLLDDDCDGTTDEGVQTTCYADADGDGYAALGAAATMMCACSTGYTATSPVTAADCDDADITVNPAVPEVCNGLDDNCNGTTDEGLGNTYFRDADGDGHGIATTTMGCTAPAGYASVAGDCDDAQPSVHPGQPEACDGLDTDCSGALGTVEDADADGYPTAACRALAPSGSAPAAADCNDAAAAVHPSAPDVCDGVDSNCDGSVEDMDGDSYSPPSSTCVGGAFPKTDCNDTVAAAHPGGSETCNGVDDDCDGTVDGVPATTWCNAPPRGDVRTTYSCTSGTCGVGACTSLWGDCTATAGCETYLVGSTLHCGSCANACKLACGVTSCDEATTVVAGANASTTCAIRSSGQAICWGRGDLNQLGSGAATAYASTPTMVSLLWNAAQIDVGQQHVCARRRTGQVSCWGSGASGEIGNGALGSAPTPADVTGLTDAIDLSAGGAFTCAVRMGGQVVCWGYNGASGELGNASATVGAHSTFVTASVANATQVTAGANHACAIRTGGQAVCWGANGAGQLGDDVFEPSTPTAVDVTGIANAVEIRAGASHTCVRRAGGAVWCWGFNANGQLGDTTTNAAYLPVSTGITDATALAAGSRHTCAIVSTIRGSGAAASNVLCWGANTSGGLGDGTTMERHAPTPVPGLSDAVVITAGGSGVLDYSCALRATGQLVCWGGNNYGQLGDGGTGVRFTPTNVVAM